ncbi:MAG TPA: protein FdrA, partial [Thermoanaerobaculia bacterium]|nr:protein FdrA [Thermoanaerobaculia bacterium]
MSALCYQLRPGAYCDSIVLLQVQKGLAGLPGVLDASAGMATETNLELLAAQGLLPAGLGELAPDDLLVVVRGESEQAALGALAELDSLLHRRASGGEEEDYRFKSLAAASRAQPHGRWVLISVPGRHAARLAAEALELGRNVFLFSDNVSLAEELELKREAAKRGLLVMGPDCGTAIVAGVGFGFANRVPRGGVGLVAASGTGLQMVASRLAALGSGVSQALGTGGRDLSAEVGGASTLLALDLLAR